MPVRSQHKDAVQHFYCVFTGSPQIITAHSVADWFYGIPFTFDRNALVLLNKPFQRGVLILNKVSGTKFILVDQLIYILGLHTAILLTMLPNHFFKLFHH